LLATSLAAHRACLGEALARFEVAATLDDSRAEARVRGGWILFQQERFAQSLDWLNVTVPAGDRDLAYWHALFRGRALESLGRFQDALSAYQTASTLYPSAQSAGIGLAFILMRLDREPEADTVARALRVSAAGAVDPWTTYLAGDYRFVNRWIDQLRAAWR
jgi:tetratricopeptide (TPR) repeat protein